MKSTELSECPIRVELDWGVVEVEVLERQMATTAETVLFTYQQGFTCLFTKTLRLLMI